MKVSNILFVCTGNICRSPMAAALMDNAVGGRGRLVSRSAGVRGVDGQPAHRLAISAMSRRGIDLSDHRARTVTPDVLMKADLILAMERYHLEWISRRMPVVSGKMSLLGYRSDTEIPDPIGGDEEEFAHIAETINGCINEWLQQLDALEE